MKVGNVMAVGMVFAVLLSACSNNDELIAAKEQAINEKSAENERLKRQLADAESTRMVVEKQLSQKQIETDRLREETARLNAAPPVNPLPGNENGETPASAGSKGEVSARPSVRIDDKDIEVETNGAGEVVLRLKGAELFTSGSADLTASGQKVLAKVAEAVKKYPDYRLSIEGHTDDTPLKKTAARWKTNLNLSIARALAVRQHLNQRGKVDDDRMSVVGWGETKPLVPNTDDKSRARNRRVEIVLKK